MHLDNGVVETCANYHIQATGGSVARERGDETGRAVFGQGVGREGEEGLGGLPNDVVSQGKKDRIGLADTTNESAAAKKAAGEK